MVIDYDSTDEERLRYQLRLAYAYRAEAERGLALINQQIKEMEDELGNLGSEDT